MHDIKVITCLSKVVRDSTSTSSASVTHPVKPCEVQQLSFFLEAIHGQVCPEDVSLCLCPATSDARLVCRTLFIPSCFLILSPFPPTRRAWDRRSGQVKTTGSLKTTAWPNLRSGRRAANNCPPEQYHKQLFSAAAHVSAVQEGCSPTLRGRTAPPSTGSIRSMAFREGAGYRLVHIIRRRP